MTYKELNKEKSYIEELKQTNFYNYNYTDIKNFVKSITIKYDLTIEDQAVSATNSILHEFFIFRPIVELINAGFARFACGYLGNYITKVEPDGNGTFTSRLARGFTPIIWFDKINTWYEGGFKIFTPLTLNLKFSSGLDSYNMCLTDYNNCGFEELTSTYDSYIDNYGFKYKEYKNKEYLIEQEKQYKAHKQKYMLNRFILLDTLRKSF